MNFSQLENKTILLTGANGFIGKHLLAQLIRIPNIHLLALSRRSISQDLTLPHLKWLYANLQDLTPNFWQQHQVEAIDIVVHLGAFIPKSTNATNDARVIFQDNLYAMQGLFGSLPCVPEHIIFSSTIDVYAASQESIDEQSPLGPFNLYAASKIFGEEFVKSYAQQHDCAYSILRYGHIYGPGEFAYRKFIPETIRALIANKPPIIYGDGSTLRDFLYVDDAAKATLLAMQHGERQLGPVNIVSGNSVSLKEIVDLLISCADKHIQAKYLLDKPNGLSLRFNHRLMHDLLGRWELTPLMVGLKEEYADFEQNCL